MPGDVGGDGGIRFFHEGTVVVSAGTGVDESVISSLDDLAPGNEGVLAVPVLRRSGNPSFVGTPNAVAP